MSKEIRRGTPPKNSKARRQPSWKTSMQMRSNTCTKKASEWGSTITKKATLRSTPACVDQGVAEIHLRLAGMVDERHEHLPGALPDLSHRLLDLGIAAGVALLIPEALEDTLGGVALLAVDVLVFLQDLTDAGHVRPQFRPVGRLFPAISRRLAVRQDLLQRLPVKPRLPQHLPLANSFVQNTLPDS